MPLSDGRGVSLQPEPLFQPPPPPPRLWLTKRKVFSSIRKILGLLRFYSLGHLVKCTSIISWEKPPGLGIWGNRVRWSEYSRSLAPCASCAHVVGNLAMPRELLPLWGSATQPWPWHHGTTCSFHTSGAGSEKVGLLLARFPPWRSLASPNPVFLKPFPVSTSQRESLAKLVPDLRLSATCLLCCCPRLIGQWGRRPVLALTLCLVIISFANAWISNLSPPFSL